MTTFQYLDEGNSEAQDRLATSFLLAQTSTGLATTGVLSGLVVTQTTTASGAVLVAAGAAPVQASVGTGVALLVNDTQATLDVFTANPMGALPRNDIVVFDMLTKAIIAIIGTPNATPDDPTVPATACALARLRHAASATTIPTAKIDDLRAFTALRGTNRVGASVNLTDGWVTQATRTHTGTWSVGENSGGFVGALTGNTTPIVIPAGKGGLYAVSLGLANSAAATGWVQVQIGGTLLAGSTNFYRGGLSTASFAAGGVAAILPLAAGCALTVITGLTASAYGVTATLSCYRIGD